MAVSLRPMTPEEFGPYEDADAHRYAEGMVKAGCWSADGAFKRAKEAHARLLPEGLKTEDQFLLVIEAPQAPRPVGVAWLSVNRETAPPTGFIYDLLIHEPFRRTSFGRQAMLALEAKARDLGLASLSLHVFQDNTPARTLYSSLGYLANGTHMTKALSPATKKGPPNNGIQTDNPAGCR
jgi:ribosomal protein S18 acetylase RimI-like enzyme